MTDECESRIEFVEAMRLSSRSISKQFVCADCLQTTQRDCCGNCCRRAARSIVARGVVTGADSLEARWPPVGPSAGPDGRVSEIRNAPKAPPPRA